MSIRTSLKSLVASLGGTSTAKSVPGLLGEVITALGGTDAGNTIAEKIDVIAATKWASNPLSGLAADVNIGASVDLLGKVVGDLQKDIVIGTNSVTGPTKITGTSKYVTGYNGFSGKAAERKGNYLALHFGVPDMTIGTDVTVKVNNVSLDPDGLHIIRFKDGSFKPKLIVTAEKDGYNTYTKVYDLSEIVRVQPS